MHKKSKNLRSDGWKIWIGAGALLIGAALALTLYNVYEADKADRSAQAAVSELQAAIGEGALSEDGISGVDGDLDGSRDGNRAGNDREEDIVRDDADAEMPVVTIDGYDYIGYLEVPEIGLSLPIMSEWDNERLKIAPCRYAGTLAGNNLVLAGHNYRKHFSPLRWQSLGTAVNFIDVNGEVTHYEISAVEILQPTQIQEMITARDDWDLTLFTCTVGGNTRYTIRCKRVE